MTQQLLTIWSQIPLAFLNPAWISASLWFMYYSSLAWKILNITSLWDECNYTEVWTFVGIAFLWDWNESWPFPVLWPLLSFPNCWHIECSTFTASSFKIWNSSTGAPSPPLALFTEMLSKTHLTSHSRMSGSRWMITPSWLSGSWRSFCIVLLFIFATSFWYNLSLLGWNHFSYCAHLCMKISLGISNFLQEISSLSHSIVFLYFFALITEEGFLISPCYSLKLCIQMGISFLFSFAFASLPFTVICKASSDSHVTFLHFFFPWEWSWSPNLVQCHKTLSIVLQALYQI